MNLRVDVSVGDESGGHITVLGQHLGQCLDRVGESVFDLIDAVGTRRETREERGDRRTGP